MNSRLTVEYINQMGDYELYLNKSRYIRILYKTSQFLIVLFIILTFGGVYMNIKSMYVYTPETIVNYIYGVIRPIIIIIGFPMFLISIYLLNRVRNQCRYEDINIAFIYIYKALSSLDDYINKKTTARKIDSIKYLKEGYKIIQNWDYGNIPLISDEIIKKIDFIINDLKYIILNLINSKDEDIQKKALDLLHTLTEFLQSYNLNVLDILNKSINLLEPDLRIIHRPLKMEFFKVNIRNHPIISQILFTILISSVPIIISKNLDVEITTVVGWIIILFVGSFTIFDTIKQWIL